MIPFLVIGAVVLLAGFAVWSGHKKARARREALEALAVRLGLLFDESRDSSHDEQYAQFGMFRRGHGRAAYNTLSGNREIAGTPHKLVMGDFTYRQTSGSGKNRRTTTYHLSYLLLHLPLPGVPDLFIRPETVMDKIGAAMGFDDIDFESAEFSKKFLVKSSDRRFAYDVITPRLMEFLLDSGRPPVIDLERGVLCLADGNRRWEPDRFVGMLGFAETFLGHWPEHVVRDLQSRAV